MKTHLKYLDNMTMIAKSDSNHWTVFDTKNNGDDASSTPLEGVLQSLCSCTSMDVVSILKKMKVDIRKFEIQADAKVAEDHPHVFTKIHLIYRLWADTDQEKLAKAVKLSYEKYCPVIAMVKKTAKITYEHQLVL